MSADFQRDEEAARALVEERFPLHKAAAMKGQEGALIVLMETVEADQEDSSSGADLRHSSLHKVISRRFRGGWLLHMPSTNQDIRGLKEQQIDKSEVGKSGHH